MSAEKQKDEPDVPSVDPALPSDPPANEAPSADDGTEILNDLKCKLQTLVGTYEDMLEGLSPNIRKRVDYLRDVQKEHDELEQKFLEERATLEAKYQKLYHPLYTKRFEIVTGKVEVEDGVDEAKGETASEEKEQEKVSDKAEVEETVSEAKEGTGSEEKEQEEKGIPEFWLNAMRNNEVLADEIEGQDEEALKYLTDIKWNRIDDHKGFKLEFFFEPNPFFKNPVLTKIYSMIDEDEPILEKAIGTEIEWYPGKCLTQKILKKKPKGTATGAKPITKAEKCYSFFNFFDPPNVPEDGEEMDEDSAEQLQNQIEEDFDVGSVIKNKIIPHAVSWFTGEAIKDEDFQIIEVEDDDDDEEDEDNEEEDGKHEEGELEGKKTAKKDGQANAGEVKT